MTDDEARRLAGRIFDELRQKFWHYFVRQHPFQIPAKNINFDEPWWMQKR